VDTSRFPNEEDPPRPLSAQLSEPLEDLLNFDTWRDPNDLGALYARIEQQVRDSTEQEDRVAAEVRRRVLPLICRRSKAPKGAGLYNVNPAQLKWAHHNLLFNGATLAADGTVVAHDTLLMTIAQIGVCTVSYQGDTGEFRKQLFRRDFRINTGDPVEEMVAVLEQRQHRTALGYEDERDDLNNLMRRGLMAYAERGLLLDKAEGRWMMGHGAPAPRELLTVGLNVVLESSLAMLNRLILQHQKFVYVPSAPRELLMLTLGDTLSPLQFLIVDTLEDQLQSWLGPASYSRSIGRRVQKFVEEVGPQVVRGVFRAAAGSPPCVFYAHIDHAQEAALIAMADSALQEYRGFPMLLSLADNLCRASFEPASFRTLVQQGYAAAGHPYRYLTERETR
jgi:hypothetical protein